MTVTNFEDTAKAITYLLGEPPTRVDWAVACVYADPEEIRYRECDDETEARSDADGVTLDAILRGHDGGSMPVRAFPAYREVREMPDGTQIISPWRDATDISEGI